MTRTPPLDWCNILLLAFVHVVALGGMALYWPLHGLTVSTLMIAGALTLLTIFSISAGYHRLFSHRSYEAHPLLRGLLLAIGAGAFQKLRARVGRRSPPPPRARRQRPRSL